jgi:hypothetical protein
MLLREQRRAMVGKYLKKQWEENYLANKGVVKEEEWLSPSYAKPQDFRPALCVGAGPSLGKNLDKIDPKLYDVVACDKISGLLVDIGVMPKYIVALNAAPTSVRQWIEKANKKDVTLVMPIGVHPSTYEGWVGERIFINAVTSTSLHERVAAEMSQPSLTIGSNAGTFAYLLACMTMHNPIGFIGMDFSFTSRSAVLDKQDARHYNLIEMSDINGETRYLNLGWMDMAEAFQEACMMHAQWFGIETFNCTEGGINYSQWVSQVPLVDFNKMLVEKFSVDLSKADRWGGMFER